MRNFKIVSALVFVLVMIFIVFSCSQPYEPDLDASWSLVLESLDSSRTRVSVEATSGTEPSRIVRRMNQVEVIYEKPDGLDVDVAFRYTSSKKGFEVVPSVTNREDGYVVLELEGPYIDHHDLNVEEMDLILPLGVGARYHFPEATADKDWKEDKEDGSLSATFEYCGQNCNMQWAEFTGNGKNLYFACHDSKFRWKDFKFKYYKEKGRLLFAFSHHFTCFPGEDYTCPQMQVQWLDGDWKSGARKYSEWFHKTMEMPEKPKWVSRSNGWLLTILKQQNDVIMWDYEEMGTELLDIAQARGLDIIGLFGWTIGGHDRFYPDYDPDPRMGGEEGLRNAVKRIHERGMKAVFYFNGQLIDQHGTDFWPETGQHITVVGPDGQYRYERWWKYANIEPRIHGLACLGTEAWRERLLGLTRKVYEYGADGVIYDQLATRPPMLCYGEGHGHGVPAVVYEQDRKALLEYLNSEMRKIAPEFLIMTEGIADYEVNKGATMFHGHSANLKRSHDDPQEMRNAFATDDRPFFTVFPDMFHYTIPEADFTIRIPTPASTRLSLNFGTVFGYKHEIETRYMPDKLYLTDDRIPAWEEYDDVKGRKPIYSTLTDQNPHEVTAYSHAVLSFRKAYSDVFYDGRFSSDEGFTLISDSPDVIARSYIDGRRMGVIAWNISDEQNLSFVVSPEKGWHLVDTAAPEGTPVEGALPAQSLRLFVYER